MMAARQPRPAQSNRCNPGPRPVFITLLALFAVLALPLGQAPEPTLPWPGGETPNPSPQIDVVFSQAATVIDDFTKLRATSGSASGTQYRLTHSTAGLAEAHVFQVEDELPNADYELWLTTRDAHNEVATHKITFKVNAASAISLLDPLLGIAAGAPFDALYAVPRGATCEYGLTATPAAIVFPMERVTDTTWRIRNLGSGGEAGIEPYIRQHTEQAGAPADAFFDENAKVFVECRRPTRTYPIFGHALGVDPTPPTLALTVDPPTLTDSQRPRAALTLQSDDKARCTLTGPKFCTDPACTGADCEARGDVQLATTPAGAYAFDFAHACDFTRYQDLYPYSDDPADPDTTPEILEERRYDFTLTCENRAGTATPHPFTVTVRYTEAYEITWTHPAACDALPNTGQVQFATNVDVATCTLKTGDREVTLAPTPAPGRSFTAAASQLGSFAEGPQTLQYRCPTAFNPAPPWREHAFTIDRTSPTMSALTAPEGKSCNLLQFELAFDARDNDGGCGVRDYTVKVTRPNLPANPPDSERTREFVVPLSPFVYSSALSPAPPGLSGGEEVRVEVKATDRAGQSSAPLTKSFRVEDPETSACDVTRPVVTFSSYPNFRRADIKLTCNDLDWLMVTPPSGCNPAFKTCTTTDAQCTPAAPGTFVDKGDGLFVKWLEATETQTWCYEVKDNAGNTATGCQRVEVGNYPLHCFNNALDAELGETDLDCGGPCPPCGSRCGDRGETDCPGGCPFRCGRDEVCISECEARPDCEPRVDPDCDCGPTDRCPAGYTCESGRCQSPCGADCAFNGWCGVPTEQVCTDDAQCADGQRCQVGANGQGRCVDLAAGQRRCDGLTCPLDADCPSGCGWNCEDNDRCVEICNRLYPKCSRDPDCACTRTPDCPPGFTCRGNVCVPTDRCRPCVEATSVTDQLCQRCARDGCQLPPGCAGPYPCPYTCEGDQDCNADCQTDHRCLPEGDPDCTCSSTRACPRGTVCQQSRCVPDPACTLTNCGRGDGCDQRCFNEPHCRPDPDCQPPCTLNCLRGDTNCNPNCDPDPNCAKDPDCVCEAPEDCAPPRYPNHHCENGLCIENPRPCPVNCASDDGVCGGNQCKDPPTPPCTFDQDCACPRTCARDCVCDDQCTTANNCEADPDCAPCRSTPECRQRCDSQYWVCRNNRCEPVPQCTLPNCGEDGTCNEACARTPPCPEDPDCRPICRLACGATTPPVCNLDCATTPPCTADPDCCATDADCRTPQYPNHRCEGHVCVPRPPTCPVDCTSDNGACGGTQCREPVTPPCTVDSDCTCHYACALDTYCDRGNCTTANYCPSDPDCAPCTSTPECRVRYNSTGWICSGNRCVPNPQCPLPECGPGDGCNNACATTPNCPADPCPPPCTLNCTVGDSVCNRDCVPNTNCPPDTDCCTADADCRPPQYPNHRCEGNVCVPNPPRCPVDCSDTDGRCGGTQCRSPPTPPCDEDEDCVCRWNCTLDAYCDGNCTAARYCRPDPDCASCAGTPECRARYNSTGWICSGNRCVPNPQCPLPECGPGDGCNNACATTPNCPADPCPPACTLNCTVGDDSCNRACATTQGCLRDTDCVCERDADCRPPTYPAHHCDSGICRRNETGGCSLTNCGPNNRCNEACRTTPGCAPDPDCTCQYACALDTVCDGNCTAANRCPADSDCAPCSGTPECQNRYNSTAWVCDGATRRCKPATICPFTNCTADNGCNPLCATTPGCREDPDCRPPPICPHNCAANDALCVRACEGSDDCRVDTDCNCYVDANCARFGAGWRCLDGGVCGPPNCEACVPGGGCARGCGPGTGCPEDPDCACQLTCVLDRVCNEACASATGCRADPDCSPCTSTPECLARYNETGWICNTQNRSCQLDTRCPYDCRADTRGICERRCDEDSRCHADPDCRPEQRCQLNCTADSFCNAACSTTGLCQADPDCNCLDRPCPSGQRCDSGRCVPGPGCPVDCTDDNGRCGGDQCKDPPAAGCDIDRDCLCLKNCDPDQACDPTCTSQYFCPADPDCAACAGTPECQARYNSTNWVCDASLRRCVQRACRFRDCGPGDGCNEACDVTPFCVHDRDCDAPPPPTCELNCTADAQFCNQACGTARNCQADPDCNCGPTQACPSGQHCDSGRCRPNPTACPVDCTDDNGRCGGDQCKNPPAAGCDTDTDCLCLKTCRLDRQCDPACTSEYFCPSDPDCAACASTPECQARYNSTRWYCDAQLRRCTERPECPFRDCGPGDGCNPACANSTGCLADSDCLIPPCAFNCGNDTYCIQQCDNAPGCGPDPNCRCASTPQCPPGHVCQQQRCVPKPECRLTCRLDQTCVPGCDGATCPRDPDCDASTCDLNCARNGRCNQACKMTPGCAPDPDCSCARDADCPGGFKCTPPDCVPKDGCPDCATDRACTAGCDGVRCPLDEDCGGGCIYICETDGQCVPECATHESCRRRDPDCQCESDSECTGGLRCVRGRCQPTCTACAQDGACTPNCGTCPPDPDCRSCTLACGSDGLCNQDCAMTAGCAKDPDCACASTPQCPPGFVCTNSTCIPKPTCPPTCRADGRCDQRCDGVACPPDPDCPGDCAYLCGSDGQCIADCGAHPGCGRDPDCVCTTTPDCPEGFVCQQSRCVPRTDACPACGRDGTCTAGCDGVKCPPDPDCPGGCGYLCGRDGQCRPECAASPGCAKDPDCACASTPQCPPGMVCQNSTCLSAPNCTADCAANGSCESRCGAGACPADPDCGGPCPYLCSANGACNLQCAGANCTPDPDCRCRATPDCPAGFECKSGRCEPKENCPDCGTDTRCDAACDQGRCPDDLDCPGGCPLDCRADGQCLPDCEQTPSCRADPDCLCTNTTDCPRGRVCTGGRCVPAASCPTCALDKRCDAACTGLKCPVDPDCAGLCPYLCGPDPQCVRACADTAACAIDADCAQCQGPQCTNCTGAACSGCEGEACQGCRGPDCPGCTGPECQTCQGPDCQSCEGPTCQTCTGAACPGCAGPDCTTCRGIDCATCETPGCAACDGKDCTGFGCKDSSDCATGICKEGKCAPAQCSDTLKNGDETDVDCGGPCPTCGVGKLCGQDLDCTSQFCNGTAPIAKRCALASCTDKTRNGDESDVDCGGACKKCEQGKQCRGDADCAAGTCQGGLCKPKTKTCQGPQDCATGELCKNATCQPRGCQSPKDCGEGEACQAGKCVLVEAPTNPIRHAVAVIFLLISILLILGGGGYLVWSAKHAPPMPAPTEPPHTLPYAGGPPAEPGSPPPKLPPRESQRTKYLREQAKRARDEVRRKMRAHLFSHFEKPEAPSEPQLGHIPARPPRGASAKKAAPSAPAAQQEPRVSIEVPVPADKRVAQAPPARPAPKAAPPATLPTTAPSPTASPPAAPPPEEPAPAPGQASPPPPRPTPQPIPLRGKHVPETPPPVQKAAASEPPKGGTPPSASSPPVRPAKPKKKKPRDIFAELDELRKSR